METLECLTSDSKLIFDELPIQLKVNIFWLSDPYICRSLSKEYQKGSESLVIDRIRELELSKKELLEAIKNLPQVAVCSILPNSYGAYPILVTSIQSTLEGIDNAHVHWSFTSNLNDSDSHQSVEYWITTLDGLEEEKMSTGAKVCVEDRNMIRHKMNDISTNAIYYIYLQRLLSYNITNPYYVATQLTLNKLNEIVEGNVDDLLFAYLYSDCSIRGLPVRHLLEKLRPPAAHNHDDSKDINIYFNLTEDMLTLLDSLCNCLHKVLIKSIENEEALMTLLYNTN